MKEHPKALSWWEGDEEIVRCPVCGNEEEIDGYDVIGADPGCLFCNQCDTEIDCG